jgi:GYF domain 2
MSHDRTIAETDTASPSGDAQRGLEPSVDADAWAWATEHGAPEWASTAQLVLWLARGELPPHTLVWKPGWGEWLPALQVAEFAAAFPGVTQGSRRMARAAAEVTPPPVPVAHYPRLRLLAKDVLSESGVTPFTAVAAGLAPARVGRSTLRDLDLAQKDLVTSQVPAAAMLEAARSMKRPGAALAPSRSEHWSGLNLGTFGEPPPPASTPARAPASDPRTLSPLALELGSPASPEPQLSESPARPGNGYGRWLLVGTLVGGALGLLSVRGPWPHVAVPAVVSALLPALAPAPEAAPIPAALPPAPPAAPEAPARAVEASPALSVAEELPRGAPPSAKKPPGGVQVKRNGEPAVLNALRVSKNDGFDRIVFEFLERVPGYHLAYVDKPVRDCGSGDARRIEGDGRLQVRFSPASAHTEGGEPTLRQREFKPALSMVREIERTCDFEGVVTWVVGTASPQPYRVYELSSPPRLVVQIEH